MTTYKTSFIGRGSIRRIVTLLGVADEVQFRHVNLHVREGAIEQICSMPNRFLCTTNTSKGRRPGFVKPFLVWEKKQKDRGRERSE